MLLMVLLSFVIEGCVVESCIDGFVVKAQT